MKRALAVAALAVCAGCSRVPAPTRALAALGFPGAKPRNVLVVSIDTLRADRVGCYGGSAATPNIDRLAAHGARFTAAHSVVPLTLPAHLSLFTGVYPQRHGVEDNGLVFRDASLKTAAELFHDAGYETGAFVGAFVLDRKWG